MCHRYSGEMREIGVTIDDIANVLWENVSSIYFGNINYRYFSCYKEYSVKDTAVRRVSNVVHMSGS